MKKYCVAALTMIMSLQLAVSQTVIRGPYLQSLTPTSIKIKWRTSTATDSRVSYGSTSGSLTTIKDDGASVTDHTIQLTNLQPNTVYYYSVGTTAQVLSGPDSLHYFKTAPVSGTAQPYRFWAIGDFGKNNQGQRDVMNSCVGYTASTHVDMWLWLGDCAYDNGTDAEYQTKVFDVYKDIMKYMPFYPCPGNHDYNSVCAIPCFSDPVGHSGPYFDMVDVPKNGEAGGVASGYELYYSFDYGNVHFVSLNSELGSLLANFDWNGVYGSSNFNNSPAKQWLINDLSANTLPWVVVYFHQPPYTDGSHNSDDLWEIYMKAMRDNYTPVFEQYGVDIVLCGHSHVYERSYLMKGFHGSQYPTSASFDMNTHVINNKSGNFNAGEAYIKYTDGPSVNQGTIYVVNGNSGSREQGAPLNHPAMYYDDDGYGSFFMEVNGMRFDGKYLSSNGTVLDEFTILKLPSGAIFSEVNITICEGESHYAGGASQTVTGTYYDTISGSPTDTILATNLTVINPVRPVITEQSNILSVPAAYAAYEWYKDGLQLTGETTPSIIAISDGQYYVKVTDNNGCLAYSDTFTVVIIGIGQPGDAGIKLFPNPVHNDVQVIFSTALVGDMKIEVHNTLGEKVVESFYPAFNGDSETISFSDLKPGIYLIRVVGESWSYSGRVVRN